MDKENIIQKQIVYLHVHKPVASPFGLQEATAKWCSEILADAIGRKLEKYSSMESVIRIDKIEIALNTADSLDNSLAERIAFEVEKEIHIRLHAEEAVSGNVIISKERTIAEAFIFFLRNGYLPWWSNLRLMEDLVMLKQFSNEERHTFKELLHDKTKATRLATALPLNIFKGILSKLFEVSETEANGFFQKMERLASKIDDKDHQHQFLFLVKQKFVTACVEKEDEAFIIGQAIDLLLGKYQISAENLMRHMQLDELLSKDISLQHILSGKIDFAATTPIGDENDLLNGPAKTEHSEKFIEQKLQLEKQQLAQKKDGIYIGNAGLVLLAPFIPRFFENLGIVENNLFNSKDLALALLQWLVTGNELHAEFDLVLPKIICGMEPEDPVIVIPYLPEGYKKEGETLLQSVIGHWSILKNTSIDGLRESFLQREGKLSFQENEWLLQVEQKPYDMLLEHLPWNINMIRLSWMPCLLRTEWMG